MNVHFERPSRDEIVGADVVQTGNVISAQGSMFGFAERYRSIRETDRARNIGVSYLSELAAGIGCTCTSRAHTRKPAHSGQIEEPQPQRARDCGECRRDNQAGSECRFEPLEL